jgi:hypothetical protein
MITFLDIQFMLTKDNCISFPYGLSPYMPKLSEDNSVNDLVDFRS